MGNERYKDGTKWKVKGYTDVTVAQSASTPVAPTGLTGASITNTGVTLSWTLSASTGITAQRIYRNNTLFATINDNTTTSLVVTGLVASTPYTWNISAFNGASGINSPFSSTYSMSTTGTILTQSPNIPGSFAAVKNTGSPTTSVDLSWAASAVDGTHDAATGYRVFVDGVQNGADLGSGVTSKTITGLANGSSHTFTAKAFNTTGASGSTSGINVKLDNVASNFTMLMGTSLQTVANHGGISQWDVVRAYKFSTAQGTAAMNMSPKVLAITDPAIAPEGGSASATALQNALETFYYGSGSAARQNIQVHWAPNNEGTHKVVNLANFVNTVALQSAVINRVVGGVRRYPLASMWLDATTTDEGKGLVASSLNPCAQYLDGVAWSLYPNTLDADKVATSNSQFQNPDGPTPWLEQCMQRTISAANLAGVTLDFAMWEGGTRIDTDDKDHRPFWTTHSLVQWCYERAIQLGIRIPIFIWWEGDTNYVASNPWRNTGFTDPTGTNPTTAQAFRNWQSYIPAYGGSVPAAWAGLPKSPPTWPTGA